MQGQNIKRSKKISQWTLGTLVLLRINNSYMWRLQTQIQQLQQKTWNHLEEEKTAPLMYNHLYPFSAQIYPASGYFNTSVGIKWNYWCSQKLTSVSPIDKHDKLTRLECFVPLQKTKFLDINRLFLNSSVSMVSLNFPLVDSRKAGQSQAAATKFIKNINRITVKRS